MAIRNRFQVRGDSGKVYTVLAREAARVFTRSGAGTVAPSPPRIDLILADGTPVDYLGEGEFQIGFLNTESERAVLCV